MATEVKPVWYAGPDSRWGELWTMLHPPYTAMVLSFVVVGAVIVPGWSGWVLSATLAAYFLGLGVGAHFLDQIPGMGSSYVRHWPSWALWAGGLSGVAAAVGIGVVGAILVLGPTFLLFVVVQGVAALGYPLAPLFRGALHRESVFAISWGSLPFLTSFYAQARTITLLSIVLACAFAGLAVAEIRLSRISRARRALLRAWPEDRTRPGSSSGPSVWAVDLSLAALVTGACAFALALFLLR
jgi:hypothetical protein